MDLGTEYKFIEIEEKWVKKWRESGERKSNGDKFSIIMPPPNITGVLHVGHVLNMTIQDVLIRNEKEKGKNVLWFPGLDHAAIATESKVVEFLKKEKGIEKKDISREQFIKYCWEWKEKYGSVILQQIEKLGCLCDWDKLKFTLDEKVKERVVDVFIKMFNDRLIYRSVKMINWDPKNKTALSDEEVIYRDVENVLYFLEYKFVGEDNSLVVATSRPETIFGDVAVCVNPSDERYKKYIGKKVVVPIVGKEIEVVADEYVDKEFGTGCLKVTPAHDFNDYILGNKHGFESIDILNSDGTLNKCCGEFCGLDRFVARKEIVKKLKENGLLKKEERYKSRVGFSERSNAIVEPKLSKQWFIKMSDLAKKALEVVLVKKEIEFYPEKCVNDYRPWLENIQDWCISRQLWWGHRIPVYYFEDKVVAAKNIDEAVEILKKQGCNNVDNSKIKQDEDVLDTWFSSALWPQVVTEGFVDLPTDVLVTGADIIFFWVARMIIMSYYLGDKAPFKKVYFTGIIRDKNNKKMSKSLGNSPDILKMIEEYGADGVRFGILLSTQAGNDLKFDEKLCKQGRNFCRKIWNAYRLLNIWKDGIENDGNENGENDKKESVVDDLMKEVDECRVEIEGKMKEYKINEAAMILYRVVWDRFCSFYLEEVKEKYCKNKSVINGMFTGFYELIKMLNPFMPFLASEILEYKEKEKYR